MILRTGRSNVARTWKPKNPDNWPLRVAAKGKRISFRAGGETVDSKVSGSRTRIFIAGQTGDRANLEEGMTCTIEYLPGGDNEARLIDCGD